MKITDLLIPGTMNLNLEASSKTEVIAELVNMLYSAGRISDEKKFKKAIFDREKLSTTGIGDGVAIPHAKNKTVIEPTLAFGISKKGINYDSLDQKPAHIFFMIAVPKKGENLHLEALSSLARMLIHEDFRTGLIQANTKEDVLTLIDNNQN